MSYDLYSKFDVEQHAKKYLSYTEVIILPNGEIVYAVPSHQRKLIDICMKKYNLTQEEINDRCPIEYHLDFNQWLCNITECISVWYSFCMIPESGITPFQYNSLRILKDHKCYSGNLP